MVGWVLVVAVPGIAALTVAATAVPSWTGLLIYAGVFAATEVAASRLRDGFSVSLGNLVILVALLDQGWGTAVLCVVGGLVVDLSPHRDLWALKATFNLSSYALSAAATSLTFLAVVNLSGSAFPDGLSVLGALLAGLVGVLVNLALVTRVVATLSGESYRSAIGSALPVVALQVPYTGISILAAVLLRAGGIGPLLLVLLFLPVFIARSGLSAFQRVDEAYDRLVRTFVTAIEVKDLYTRGHSERVAKLSVLVAEQLGIPYQERRLTGYAALLHDVGKIGVPLCVINKPGPLDDDEFEQIKQHPTIGAEILGDIDFLEPVLDIVRYHHERLDGRGYPHGIGEDELGELVRIVTTVDAFDAMTSTRSYRRAMSVQDAVAELRRCAGRQFDPEVVEALAARVDRLGWTPTVEFASEEHLRGQAIPVGSAVERLQPETGS